MQSCFMKTAAPILASGALAFAANARDLTYDTAHAGVWTDAASWQEGLAPESGDTLLIPGDARLTDDDAAAVASIAQLTIAKDATLTVEATSTITVGGFVSGDGRLVKLGAGVLEYVPSANTTIGYGETKQYYLGGGTVISNGTLRFPVNTAAPGNAWNVGQMTIVSPGVLDVPANCNFVANNVTGDGTILNSKGTITQLRFTGTSVFDGFLSGSGIRVYTQANITFTCMTNTIAYGEFATWGGTISLPWFGNMSEPSPAGIGATIKTRDYGGTIRYIGPGETTDHAFSFQHLYEDNVNTFDAGPTGGVTFTGSIALGRWGLWNLWTLAGDNTLPMVFAGPITQEQTTYIRKTGSGTWHFKDTSGTRQQMGIYEVDDGVLSFDSIANIGQSCALGPQTRLIPRTNHYQDCSNVVDTAFVMGVQQGKTGTLRFTGEKTSETDRLIGVEGRGRLENASTNTLHWTGGARASGNSAMMDSELILAGDTTALSTISNLRDGLDGRPLSVTKEGTGTWTFNADTTFSGTLKVREGTLRIASGHGAFTWYKWTIKENLNGRKVRNGEASGDTNIGARQLTFYDANGNSLPTGDFVEDTSHVVADLQPGTMTYDGNVIRTFYSTGNSATPDGDTGRNLNRLFDGQNTEWLVAPYTTPTRIDNPASYVSIVFRFPEGTPLATAYNVKSYGANNNRSVCAWTMSASSDGVNWFVLDEQEVDPVPDGLMASAPGFPLAEQTDMDSFGVPNAGAVEVSEGATLEAGYSTLSLPSPLTIADGATYGRITGFAVPTNGFLDVTVPFTWFRVTVLETREGKNVREKGISNDQNIQMQEFALYDDAGIRRNVGLQIDRRCDASLLEPGFATYNKSVYSYYTDRDADKLFDDATVGSGWCVSFQGIAPRFDQSDTHVQITMRLTDANPRVTSYDWCQLNGAGSTRNVTSWRLEGSPDGQHWVMLDEKIDQSESGSGQWLSNGAAFVRNQARTGFPIQTPDMSSLVSFKDFACTMDLSGCTDVTNLSKWQVRVNGIVNPKVRMIYHDGTLNALTMGTVLFFR